MPVVAPQLSIVGFNGTTLSVLTGGNADASGSQGNTADATFTWTFTPSGGAIGTSVPVPTGTTAFSLTAAYKGGYSTSKSGKVALVDLVANFSLSPNPVVKGSPLTLVNLMQKGPAATLNSVDYSINNGGSSGTLADDLQQRQRHRDGHRAGHGRAVHDHAHLETTRLPAIRYRRRLRPRSRSRRWTSRRARSSRSRATPREPRS